MNRSVVIDTNVLVVANGKHEKAGRRCVGACVQELWNVTRRAVAGRGLVVLDGGMEILSEYARHSSFSGQPGPGDAFFLWLWERQANPSVCRRVRITPDPVKGYREFPDDPRLSGFDPSDRKFVAVAAASGDAPPILNASDTDWWHACTALEEHGITVRFLCPELMPRG